MAGGGATHGLALKLQAELKAIGTCNADVELMSALLQQELPPPGTRDGKAAAARLGTIQPDLIGEGVIVEAFEAPPARQAEGVPAVIRAYDLTGREAAEALVRLLQDYGYAAEDASASPAEQQAGLRILKWLPALSGQIEDIGVLEPLALSLPPPQQTLVLREVAADVMRRMAENAQKQMDGGAGLVAAYQASIWTTHYEKRLTDLGLLEAALEQAETALGYDRALARVQPEQFEPFLAVSLNNLANWLSELGGREEALAVAEEAVALRRQLAAARPDAFTPNLATSLNNLSTMLSELGRREEALAAADEAVRLLAPMFLERPLAFVQWMATMARNYLRYCEEADRAPDMALLSPILEAFQRLQADAPDEGSG